VHVGGEIGGIYGTHQKHKMNRGYGRHDKNTALQF